VFSGAVDRVVGDPGVGDTVSIRRSDGRFLAWGAFSPHSQIRARVWSFDPDDVIDEQFIAARVHAAVARRSWLTRQSDALRLVFAESDGLPGVVIDRYGPVAVCEITSAGGERWRHAIADAVAQLAGVVSVVERADAPVRSKEALPMRVGVVRGDVHLLPVEIHEKLGDDQVLRLAVDVALGHKTGCYLDQRDNRRLAHRLAADRSVLDVCTYSGGFAIAAALGGARSVTAVDSSSAALELARRNAALNGVDVAFVEADAFADLRRRRDAGESFDLIVLDPPKLAGSERHVNRASRAYKDLNLWAMKLLTPGGMLLTFSCSGAVDESLFQKIVFGASIDAGRELRIEQWLSQAPDHPVLLTFPEARYLNGLLCVA
jgi:23S rRNA (cytosine1962-C5)-methyltransferase